MLNNVEMDSKFWRTQRVNKPCGSTGCLAIFRCVRHTRANEHSNGLTNKHIHGFADARHPEKLIQARVCMLIMHDPHGYVWGWFRDAKLRGKFGLVPHRKFHRRAGTQSSNSGEAMYPGQAVFRAVMSRRLWLVVRDVNFVETEKSLDCGVEGPVRLIAS
ncbi:uncharacterized protein EKO05_0007774 [Ascochyta rabiei]|uniref:uncharacterized protein n=1 Tax=Didymella rabiei TaxID=5454 RepID=UPI0021FCD6A6|nr:uncharacterized protein EKO05_0007774 [Ascochyta rabiei]UPX17419.1 hypothetical protein EKO05_0007774 [Ascochyta rabiei]